MPRSRPRRRVSRRARRRGPGGARRRHDPTARAAPSAGSAHSHTAPPVAALQCSHHQYCTPVYAPPDYARHAASGTAKRWTAVGFARFSALPQGRTFITAYLISTSTRERPVHRGSSTAQSAPALRTRLASIPKVSIRNVLCKGAWRHLATSTLVLLTAPPRSCCWRCAW